MNTKHTPNIAAAAPATSAGVAAFVAGALALAGCEAILGIEDVSLDPTGGGAATSSSGTAGGGGQGGQAQGDFTFAIKPTLVDVPYDGLNYLPVEITRAGGFDGAVEVDVTGAPPGLTAQPITIPPGSNQGALQVGASGTLTLGTTFQLELVATSGDLTHGDSVPARVTGKPGTLDDSFGTAGVASWNWSTDGGGLYDLRETAGGKILTAGNGFNGLGGSYYKGARLLADGALDATFNGTGIVSGTFCSCMDLHAARGIARELNGVVVLVGQASASSTATADIGVMRFKDDGTPDVFAGDAGKYLANLGGEERTLAMELSASDQALVTGDRDDQMFVARLGLEFGGNIDTDFAAPQGWVGLPVPGLTSAGQALAFDAGGRVLAAGWVDQGQASGRDLVLLRLTPAGVPDTTFATGGELIVAKPGEQDAVAVTVQPDGRILVVASTDEAGTQDFLLLRFEPTGEPDASFGNGGEARLDATGGADRPVDMVRLLDGRVLIAGNGGGGPLLARVLPTGAPDPTFGDAGVVPLYIGAEGELHSMTVTSEGKLLVAGFRQSYPFYAVVARVWN